MIVLKDHNRTIWTDSPLGNTAFIHEYMANSMQKESPEMDRIRAAVKKAQMFVVLGYSERAGGSLYIAQVSKYIPSLANRTYLIVQSFIDPTGTIVLHRRKIKPTHVERSIWGDGQAESLTCVAPSTFGKIGGLNCWEHLQPLLRYYEYSQGVDIHVASWPPFWDKPEGVPFPHHVTADAERSACQFMAMEGACFVLVSTQVLTEANKEKTKLTHAPFAKAPGGGFSMIFGPDGTPLCKALGDGEEGILYADIDIKTRDLALQMIDVVGHYSRPDLLSLNVNSKAAKHVHHN